MCTSCLGQVSGLKYISETFYWIFSYMLVCVSFLFKKAVVFRPFFGTFCLFRLVTNVLTLFYCICAKIIRLVFSKLFSLTCLKLESAKSVTCNVFIFRFSSYFTV